MHEPVRVLLVAEGDVLTQALLSSFAGRNDAQVLGPVRDAGGTVKSFARGRVDLVVVDLDRLDARGIALVTEIRQATAAPILAATVGSDPDTSAAALAAGANGLLPADHDPDVVVRAFRRALAGELVVPDREAQPRMGPLSPVDRLAALTCREREVLDCIAEGLATKELAARLGISTATAHVHVRNALIKLGVQSKVQAVRVALLAGRDVVSRSA